MARKDKEKESTSSLKYQKAIFRDDIYRHIQSTLGNDPSRPDSYSCFMGLSYSIRDRLIERWIKTRGHSMTPFLNVSTTFQWSFCPAVS
jgi:hypothetical protein